MKQTGIRAARAEDASIIAQAVAMAIGDESNLIEYCGDDYMRVLSEIARAEDTQYSWQNALIAEVDGEAAGAIVGYDGACLQGLRQGSFRVIQQNGQPLPQIADETEAGEYYLDSIAVFPAFRGMGIAAKLIDGLCRKAFDEGHQCMGLLVDDENPQAEKLYRRLGFERVGTRRFFNHQMWHLQLAISALINRSSYR